MHKLYQDHQVVVGLRRKYKIKKRIIERLSSYGFQKPTPVQMQGIPVLLERRNILVTAPTGSGKTLSFGLPLVQMLKRKGLQAVVLEPSFELSEQVEKFLKSLAEGTKLRVESISHISPEMMGNSEVDILIASPMAFIKRFSAQKELLQHV